MNEEAQPHEVVVTTKSTLLEYIENNPVAAVVQALAVGFAVGIVVRLIEGSHEKEPEIDVKHKPTIEDAKFHLGSLLLPFLWPAWQAAREGYGKSAGTVRETVEKVKSGKLAKEGKEKLKSAEDWTEHFAEIGKKTAKEVEAWVEKEAGELTEAGKKKVEEWVEKEILPAAESGWKKLRQYFK